MRQKAITMALWVLTVVLGFFCLVYGHGIFVDFITAILVRLNPEFYATQVTGVSQAVYYCTLVAAAMVWLVIVVGGGDYHSRHAGKPRSRRALAWTLGVELLILLPSLLIRIL